MNRLDPGVRQTLSAVLRPPPGLRLDAAAGTSFTLDLKTLLAVPLTFALLDGIETPTESDMADHGEPREAPLLMSALLSYAKRIRVLSDAAYIRAPTPPSRLYSLLEPAIVPVPVAPGAHFHPKYWLLRFQGENAAVCHRLVISTRNLTDARSWDLVLVLDEDPDGKLGVAQPAVELLRAAAPDDELIAGLAVSAARAAFSPPPGFDDLRVHAWAENDGTDPTEGHSGSQMLVVSPFIGLPRLRTLVGGSEHSTVVSRTATFDRLAAQEELPRADLRCLVELTADDDGLSGELHAKLVVLDELGGRSRWWLGSLNATENGIARNAEAVVEMTTATTSGGVDALLRRDANGLGSMLEPYRDSRDTVEDDEDLEQERALRETITAADWSVRATHGPKGDLSATVAVEWTDTPPHPEAEVRVRFASGHPAERLRMDPSVQRAEATWPRVHLSDLTSFLQVDLRAPGCAPIHLTILAALEVPDDDARHAALFEAIVPDADVMLRLILVLLRSGDDPSRAAGAARKLLDREREPGDDLPSLPFVEEMVRSFARDPDRLRQAGELIDGLPDDHPRTQPLRELWDTFQEALATRG